MLSSLAVYDKHGKLAFHAYLVVDKRHSFVSTLPMELVKKYFQRELFILENLIIVNQKMADRLLSEITLKLVQCDKLKPFFYPDFLLKMGVNFRTPERLVQIQDNLTLKPGMCFSENLNPLEFYFLQQEFTLYRTYIQRISRSLEMEEFRIKYLLDEITISCFNAIDKDSIEIIEFDKENVFCVCASLDGQLKMILTT